MPRAACFLRAHFITGLCALCYALGRAITFPIRSIEAACVRLLTERCSCSTARDIAMRNAIRVCFRVTAMPRGSGAAAGIPQAGPGRAGPAALTSSFHFPFPSAFTCIHIEIHMHSHAGA